jgi:hypothetical protein
MYGYVSLIDLTSLHTSTSCYLITGMPVEEVLKSLGIVAATAPAGGPGQDSLTPRIEASEEERGRRRGGEEMRRKRKRGEDVNLYMCTYMLYCINTTYLFLFFLF